MTVTGEDRISGEGFTVVTGFNISDESVKTITVCDDSIQQEFGLSNVTYTVNQTTDQ